MDSTVSMGIITVKEEIHRIADIPPGSAAWDQVMYEICVRQKITKGEVKKR